MKREKVIELAKKAKLAAYEDEIIEFARLVEQETLERAAVVADENWSIDTARLIRNLKDSHDKE